MYENDQVFQSTRKTKKYMVIHNNKWIHFGQKGYKDFLQTGDLERRRLFRLRNAKWADAKPYSPASLSYHISW